MSQNYEPGAADALFKRVDNDETGELKPIVEKIVELCKQASIRNVTMEELATCCTMGWFIGQNPQMEEIFRVMMKSNSQDENNIN